MTENFVLEWMERNQRTGGKRTQLGSSCSGRPPVAEQQEKACRHGSKLDFYGSSSNIIKSLGCRELQRNEEEALVNELAKREHSEARGHHDD